MLRPALPRALLAAGSAALAEEGPAGPDRGRRRPYAVLQAQDAVLMGSIFSILLIAIILLAVCVYKPIRRR